MQVVSAVKVQSLAWELVYVMEAAKTKTSNASLDWKGQRWDRMEEEWMEGRATDAEAREDHHGSKRKSIEPKRIITDLQI